MVVATWLLILSMASPYPAALDPDAPRQRIELDPTSFEREAPLREIGAHHWAAV